MHVFSTQVLGVSQLGACSGTPPHSHPGIHSSRTSDQDDPSHFHRHWLSSDKEGTPQSVVVDVELVELVEVELVVVVEVVVVVGTHGTSIVSQLSLGVPPPGAHSHASPQSLLTAVQEGPSALRMQVVPQLSVVVVVLEVDDVEAGSGL